jgi:hypothetical protein
MRILYFHHRTSSPMTFSIQSIFLDSLLFMFLEPRGRKEDLRIFLPISNDQDTDQNGRCDQLWESLTHMLTV